MKEKKKTRVETEMKTVEEYNFLFQTRMPPRKRKVNDTVNHFEEQFAAEYFTETFDRQAALYLLQHSKELGLSAVPDQFVKGEHQVISKEESIQNMLQVAKGGNSLHVRYDKSTTDIDHTRRWYAKGKACLQRMSKKVRATLCRDLYIDLDFVNCGPTLLLNLCQKHTIPCDLLLEYVSNRDHLLQEFEPFYTRDEAKKVIIELMHGKSLTAIAAENTDNVHNLDGIDWLPKLEIEFDNIHKDLAACVDYAEDINNHQRKLKYQNVKLMSALLSREENSCLQHFYNFLANKSVIQNGNCVLCFDGIMVRKSLDNQNLLNDDFLLEASTYIQKHQGYKTLLCIKIKEFSDAYELPNDYTTAVSESFFVIEPGNDQAAADIIVTMAGDCIIKSQGRFFSRPQHSVVYTEGKKAAKGVILNMTSYGLVIMTESKDGEHCHYSKSTAKLSGCISRVLADPGIVDNGFVDRLWQNNLKYIAYTDGVYSFVDRRLLSFEEAKQAQIFFTRDTNRIFPHNLHTEPQEVAEIEDAASELFRRVIEPFLPDEEQRTFFLNCIARALAGEIADKRWYMGLGARDCGKGILCKLLKFAFGNLVRVMQAENLLGKSRSTDAAKAQSWMQDHEYTRIAFSNKMSNTRTGPGAGTGKIDGEIMKRLCSNGNVIEVRKNYTDEIQIRMQMTMFLLANDMPSIDPPDAYQTMHGFKFLSEFHEKIDIDDPTSAIQKNWRPKDNDLDTFIKKPLVIDAFTRLILSSYTPDKLMAPDVVKEHTSSIKGDAAESQEDRFARIVQLGDNNDVVFYKEIRQIVGDAGLGNLSDAKIDMYVWKLYALKPSKPSKLVDGKKKQDRGFKQLRLCYDGHDERAERLKKNELLKQSVRSGAVVTHDQYTSDARPFPKVN